MRACRAQLGSTEEVTCASLSVLPVTMLVALGVAPAAATRGGDHDYGDGQRVSDRQGLDSPRHLAFG